MRVRIFVYRAQRRTRGQCLTFLALFHLRYGVNIRTSVVRMEMPSAARRERATRETRVKAQKIAKPPNSTSSCNLGGQRIELTRPTFDSPTFGHAWNGSTIHRSRRSKTLRQAQSRRSRCVDRCQVVSERFNIGQLRVWRTFALKASYTAYRSLRSKALRRVQSKKGALWVNALTRCQVEGKG